MLASEASVIIREKLKATEKLHIPLRQNGKYE